jgi:hypothetical protein
MHLRVSPAWRCSLQVDLSSAAHCQTNWPCKDHVCLSCESVIVIFSTTAPSTACEKLPMSEGHHPRASSALRFLTQLLATPQYARTSVNGFCDGSGKMGSQQSTEFSPATSACPCRSACPAITEACDFTSINWTRKDMAVEEPKEHGVSQLCLHACPTSLYSQGLVTPSIARRTIERRRFGARVGGPAP